MRWPTRSGQKSLPGNMRAKARSFEMACVRSTRETVRWRSGCALKLSRAMTPWHLTQAGGGLFLISVRRSPPNISARQRHPDRTLQSRLLTRSRSPTGFSISVYCPEGIACGCPGVYVRYCRFLRRIGQAAATRRSARRSTTRLADTRIPQTCHGRLRRRNSDRNDHWHFLRWPGF